MDDRPGSRPRTAAQRTGDAAESLVAARLAERGWTVLARNVHVGRHELDVVAVDPGPPRELVIVEVRWRGRRDFGLPEETVDRHKRRNLRAAAHALLDGARLPNGTTAPVLPLRFDLLTVEPAETSEGSPRIRHHRAAF